MFSLFAATWVIAAVILLEVMRLNSYLRVMNRVAQARLARYQSVEQCGKWNCHLADDISNDPTFIRASENMHEYAMSTILAESPVSDGHSIAGIDIEIRSSLTIRYKLCFLSPTYFYAPAEFTLRLETDSSNRGIGSYRCGTIDRHGELMLNSKHCVFPIDSSEWATRFSLKLGRGTDLLDGAAG